MGFIGFPYNPRDTALSLSLSRSLSLSLFLSFFSSTLVAMSWSVKDCNRYALDHCLMSTESVMPSNHLVLCRPLLFPLSIFLSIRVFSNESVLCIRWPQYWSFSFSIIPSKEHPGLIFRLDWLDLLAVQGTFKSLLQHHSSKASILQCQLSL